MVRVAYKPAGTSRVIRYLNTESSDMVEMLRMLDDPKIKWIYFTEAGIALPKTRIVELSIV